MMPAVLVAATLAVLLALFWEHFRSLGAARVLRLALIWAAILVFLVLLARASGLEKYFT